MIKTMIPYIQEKKKGFVATTLAALFVVGVVLFALVIAIAGRYEKAEKFFKRMKEKCHERGIWKRD